MNTESCINALKILVFLSFMSFSVHAGENGSVFKPTEEEMKWLKAHPVIRVAGPHSFPPFHYVEKEGVVAGMASDYLDFFRNRLGLKLDVHTDKWQEVIEKIRDKKLDLIACAAKSPEREGYLLFTKPYLSFPMVIVSRKDSPFIGGIKDLDGKKTAVIKDVVTFDWLVRDKIRIDPVYTASPLEKLKAVSIGRADAALENLAAASYLISHEGLANLKIAAPTPYGNYDLHFAVRNDWPELVSIIDRLLDSLGREEKDAVLQKWIGVRYEFGVDFSMVRKIMGAIITICLSVIFVFWLRSRETRKNEERFRALIEHGEDIILAFETCGKISYQSPSVTTFLGYGPGSLIGSSVFDLFHEDDLVLFRKKLDEMLPEGKTFTIGHRFVNSNGDFAFMESICIDLLDKKSVGALVINARDMTKHRQSQKELQAAKDAAESADRAKTVFLAKMSHEFRTPLNAVIGFSQILIRNGKLSSADMEKVSIIRKSGEHLLDLINRVLEHSKIEAGRMTINKKTFDLDILLRDIPDIFSFRTSEKKIRIITEKTEDVPAVIRTDETKLKQILLNLMDNAVKFTDKGQILLSVALDPETEKTGIRGLTGIRFSVSDTGPGIEAHEMGALFDPFSQTASGKTLSEGAGLGLSICRRFVNLMGGEIGVDSWPGQGSTFYFSIQVEVVDQGCSGIRPDPVNENTGEAINSFENVSRDDIAAIEKAVSVLDYEEIIRISKRLENRNSEFAGMIARYANEYRFDAVHEILEEFSHRQG